MFRRGTPEANRSIQHERRESDTKGPPCLIDPPSPYEPPEALWDFLRRLRDLDQEDIAVQEARLQVGRRYGAAKSENGICTLNPTNVTRSARANPSSHTRLRSRSFHSTMGTTPRRTHRPWG